MTAAIPRPFDAQTAMKEAPFLTFRNPESHKGHFGHALLVAGSYGKMGAAVLAAKACLRSGVGLLTVHVPRKGVEILQTALPEAMVSVDNGDTCFTLPPADLAPYSAVAIGPGLGTAEPTQQALGQLLAQCDERRRHDSPFQLVLDADALNMLALHPEWMPLAEGAILTPHHMEYRRLFGEDSPQAMADKYGVVIVAKGHRTTVCAPGGQPTLNTTGNPGMATAGSGDVLTGFVLALVAQSNAHAVHEHTLPLPSATVAALSVFLHGQAGDLGAKRLGQASLMASDIIDALPQAIGSFVETN